MQPLIGGVLIGLWNVLQPYCLGEGTNFFQYLFLGVNNHTLKAKNLIGIGFVKLFATRTALGFGLRNLISKPGRKMEIIERSSSDPESQAAADRRLERIEKAIKKLNGLDARRDTLEAAVEAADRAEEISRDLEYEIVSSAPDGEQLADDYEELGGGDHCAVM